ncbi:MAG: hypothetical protein HKN93_07885 [Acidimicrobiia bacterium]|nr:hypothetical protein [Acidimicrobiia bacterium]
MDVATRAAAMGGSQDAVVAALLHDVGKRHADLGAVGRSLATALGGIRFPLRGRYLIYRDHGQRGAAELKEAFAPSLAIAFAAGHPGPLPEGQDQQSWSILAEADHVA